MGENLRGEEENTDRLITPDNTTREVVEAELASPISLDLCHHPSQPIREGRVQRLPEWDMGPLGEKEEVQPPAQKPDNKETLKDDKFEEAVRKRAAKLTLHSDQEFMGMRIAYNLVRRDDD